MTVDEIIDTNLFFEKIHGENNRVYYQSQSNVIY